MDTREQFENIRKELIFISEELKTLNAHCNDRLTKIETTNNLYNEPLNEKHIIQGVDDIYKKANLI
ncbi:MAG: hypothetical protein MJ232_01655 [archaeon]|nr:hypothetical protein [archaeon]